MFSIGLKGVNMKQLILFPLLFVFLTSIVYSAGGWDEGGWDEGTWDFGTPAPVESSSSGGVGGGDSGGGGSGRLFDGYRDRFENGSRTEIFAYGDALQFYINNKKYTLVMIKLDKDYAKLRITPNYIDFIVNEFNSNIVDIDLDGKKDFGVTFIKAVNSYSAKFKFTILEEPIKQIIDEKEPPTPIESIGGLNIEDEPKTIETDATQTEMKKSKRPSVAWIIAIIIIVLIIVSIVIYQNKEKWKKREKI